MKYLYFKKMAETFVTPLYMKGSMQWSKSHAADLVSEQPTDKEQKGKLLQLCTRISMNRNAISILVLTM
jgi:hypothetical protein